MVFPSIHQPSPIIHVLGWNFEIEIPTENSWFHWTLQQSTQFYQFPEKIQKALELRKKIPLDVLKKTPEVMLLLFGRDTV